MAEWRGTSLSPDAVRYALRQPDGVDIAEGGICPTGADIRGHGRVGF
ncbi:hypothetical protein [Sphingomonas sp. DC1400]